MQKWEYLIETIYDRHNANTILNNLGEDGWELCSIQYVSATCSYNRYFFKRPIKC